MNLAFSLSVECDGAIRRKAPPFCSISDGLLLYWPAHLPILTMAEMHAVLYIRIFAPVYKLKCNRHSSCMTGQQIEALATAPKAKGVIGKRRPAAAAWFLFTGAATKKRAAN